ncbi:hypothetical protein EJ02DRAFT_197342 [Clathrospora elynae]|uniref:Uncharacterized protein n=1 Tax=Clathrospora elynae TaxID=706981 RepID=A0A6A5T2G4_9PLEO|nr:hypothetical protein EJ02DRAFT_197342 [Clathrospora elynae]
MATKLSWTCRPVFLRVLVCIPGQERFSAHGTAAHCAALTLPYPYRRRTRNMVHERYRLTLGFHLQDSQVSNSNQNGCIFSYFFRFWIFGRLISNIHNHNEIEIVSRSIISNHLLVTFGHPYPAPNNLVAITIAHQPSSLVHPTHAAWPTSVSPEVVTTQPHD